ncbi:GNAT family N-acetyltransferase [Paenibacillus sp. GCM10023248]|uniref:GNAT family N-acetyltransferase n=1 Tax=Bacillales TaxID=1385 RepID=UPI00237874F3|nr:MULTISPECIES: GNAT family N-acetyltransferase [Bacillales]MDD9267791.1 GNAT family N-acetyltransferase [Paenibacillus sp. MAHUQ-63]MDR6882252.1 GNAT superfamily N-acetyltransferase [Bacillus sp. 3255]
MKDHLTFYKTMDLIASNTWPAETTVTLDRWLLRANHGVTKRANSVLAIGDVPSEANWLQTVERFYTEQGQPAIFQLSDASPEHLDDYLASQGYAKDLPCLMMFASSQEVVTQAGERLRNTADLSVEWASRADDEWLDAFLLLESYNPDLKSIYKGICERIKPTKGFVKVRRGNDIVAVGTAIVESEWAGFLNVVVSEQVRGQGLGYYLLHALSVWSQSQGASRQYLQVVAANTAAVSLYEKLGYKTMYGYHYRLKYDLPPIAPS